MDELIPDELRALRATAEAVVHEAILPEAEAVDRDAAWPEQAFRALRDAGLMSLQVPKRLGGHGQGLLALATITEVIGKACPSAAMCFGMHCVGTAVIAAKATKDQEERYLRPIGEGKHITTLSLSEAGTGSQFFIPETGLTRDGDVFIVEGGKQFVTNGGHADSYVMSTRASAETPAGEFSCLIVDGGSAGMEWGKPWHGVGMRGNSSRNVRLNRVRVPRRNLLGQEGEQTWYVFEVVTPYFLTAMAGTYLGIAQAALDATIQHLRRRRYSHSAESLSQIQMVQHRVGELWAAVEKTRLLLHQAGHLGDLGSPEAIMSILMCKADAGDTAVRVTNEAMTLCGGAAYSENSALARMMRDARASHVMAPTTDLLKEWAGRTALGVPLL